MEGLKSHINVIYIEKTIANEQELRYTPGQCHHLIKSIFYANVNLHMDRQEDRQTNQPNKINGKIKTIHPLS